MEAVLVAPVGAAIRCDKLLVWGEPFVNVFEQGGVAAHTLQCLRTVRSLGKLKRAGLLKNAFNKRAALFESASSQATLAFVVDA